MIKCIFIYACMHYRNVGSVTLQDVVYKMTMSVEEKVDVLHQVACGLQYLQGRGLALSWLCSKVVWLCIDLKRVCIELLNWEGMFVGKKSLELSRLSYVPPEIVWQVCHPENKCNFAVNGPGNVYQFGMLCYEMLLGRLPLEDVSVQQAEQMISGGELIVPESIDNVHAEMIRFCWNIDLWDRPSWEYITGVLR